jgi:predicted small lipoprotein YifL
MSKIVVTIVAAFAVVSLAGCVGKGKGKGPAPAPVVYQEPAAEPIYK